MHVKMVSQVQNSSNCWEYYENGHRKYGARSYWKKVAEELLGQGRK
jgi:hypothetical protein